MGTAVIILGGGNYFVFSFGRPLALFYYFGSGSCGLRLSVCQTWNHIGPLELTAYLNFNQNISTSSYHVRQILIALRLGWINRSGFG